MTVFDAMNLAQANPHGIKFTYEGSAPEKYFLTQIDDVKNEGSESGKRNWLYSVNAIPPEKPWYLQAQGNRQGFMEVFRIAREEPSPAKRVS